jgi:trigger factor
VKSKIKKMDGTAREIKITLLPETVNGAISEALSDVRANITIPGFRKGKAPEDIVRKNHHEEIMEQVKQRLIPMAYQKSLEEHEVTPASYPEISEVILGAEGAMEFTAKVDAQPEVNARKYKGIKVKGEKISVSDSEVDEVLERVRNMNAEFTDVDRAIEKGDYGICDIEAFIDGKSISKKRENAWIEASKEGAMLGMGEDICGMKKEEEKDIEVSLPDDYPDKKYAGKKATFHVKVRDVKEKKVPPIDDELAKKIGKETIVQVREELSSQLLEKKEQDRKVNMKNQVMDYLLKKNPFSLPISMVKRQQEVLVKRIEDELKQKGMDEATINEHKDKLKDKLEEEAGNKVRLYFVLDNIAVQENISASSSDVDEWLKTMAAQYNQPFEDVKKYYEENNLTGGVREQLREDKTLDFLLAEAIVTNE